MPLPRAAREACAAVVRWFVARPVLFFVNTVPWGLIFDWVMMLLGPALICLACSIVGWVIYAGLHYVLPLKAAFMSLAWFFHVGMAFWLGFNILFNYYCCARTDPGTQDSAMYTKLVHEARLQGKIDESIGNALSSSEEDDIEGGAGKGGWMNRGPFDWGWDYNIDMPKPPRSHYDHVSKNLVLNMDHYCPWMFNCVGYGNYRHFVLFMLYVWMGCLYVALETLGPFLEFSKSPRHHHHMLDPHKGGPNDISRIVTATIGTPDHYYRDRMAALEPDGVLNHAHYATARRNVTFTFMVTISVGIAISLLLGFHIYLTLSAQTTIEFYGNRMKAFKARRRGEVWTNPYDQGMRRNWEHVMGVGMHPLVAILPSRRPPAWPPYPGESRYRGPVHRNLTAAASSVGATNMTTVHRHTTV